MKPGLKKIFPYFINLGDTCNIIDQTDSVQNKYVALVKVYTRRGVLKSSMSSLATRI